MDEAVKTLACRELRRAVDNGDGPYEDLIYRCLDVRDDPMEVQRAYGRMAVAVVELCSELWNVRADTALVAMRSYITSPDAERRRRALAAIDLTINMNRMSSPVAVVLTVAVHLIFRVREVTHQALADLWPVVERALPYSKKSAERDVSEFLLNSSLLAAYGDLTPSAALVLRSV